MWRYDRKSPLKIYCGPVQHLRLIRVCVHVWQMYLRLSAWPSLSISPDRVLTAAPTEHVPANCERSGSPLRQSLLLLISLDSPHLPFPLSFTALFSLLSLSLFNQIEKCLLWVPLLASPTKASSSVLSLTLHHNPCPQYFTPPCPTVHNPLMRNPHISCSTSSTVQFQLHNQHIM